MNYNNDWHNWKNWRDIQNWCKEHKFENLVRRLQLNNDCWKSSGEFGRDQVHICDMLRYTTSEDEALTLAKKIDADSKDYMKW